MKKLIFLFLVCLLFTKKSLAFEDTKVLPKGARRFSIRMVNTNIGEKSTDSFGITSLAAPLHRQLRFQDVFTAENNPIKKAQEAGYVDANGYNSRDALGTFDADVRARVTAAAPIFAWGITNSLTLGLALPLYNAASSVDVRFHKNQLADTFLAGLSNEANNRRTMASEVATRLNNAVGELNATLQDNGYQPLREWHENGIGDLQIVAKYKTYENQNFSAATSLVVVAPTGRIDNPNVLTDVPFGDGQWDIAGQLTTDEILVASPTTLSTTQYVRYTEQLPGRKSIRLETDDEPIAVPLRRVDFKLGNKIEFGTALLIESQTGATGGIGYNYLYKMSDFYRVPAEAKIKERNTAQSSHQAEAEIGYTTVPAFLRGQFAVPFDIKLGYKHIFYSQNTEIAQLLQLETGVFF